MRRWEIQDEDATFNPLGTRITGTKVGIYEGTARGMAKTVDCRDGASRAVTLSD